MVSMIHKYPIKVKLSLITLKCMNIMLTSRNDIESNACKLTIASAVVHVMYIIFISIQIWHTILHLILMHTSIHLDLTIYIYMIFLMPNKHIIFALHIICTESMNKGIIINAILSVQNQGANSTIPSALHGTSLCLVNVVGGPLHIHNTHYVLFLSIGMKYQAINNVLRGTSDECSIL